MCSELHIDVRVCVEFGNKIRKWRDCSTSLWKRCQIPGSRFSLYSHGFMKLRFKALRERWHDWSKAGDGRIICFGKCATKSAVSFPHVTYARQTTSDRGWKVRTLTSCAASGSFRNNATCTDFPRAALRARRAAFTIYLCFPLLCTDGICQFIGMVLNLLRRWIVTYKPDLL